jgi:hypothetical protein
VYRPDGNREVLSGKVYEGPQCDPTPRHGFTGGCPDDTKKSCVGSSSVAARSPASPGWIGLGLGLAAALGLRRRRGSREA